MARGSAVGGRAVGGCTARGYVLIIEGSSIICEPFKRRDSVNPGNSSLSLLSISSIGEFAELPDMWF